MEDDVSDGEIMDDSEEESYEGQTDEHGKPHGRGTITFGSNDRFEGKFCHGVKEGKGGFIFSDGSSLNGVFKDDALNGKGTYTYDDGSTMTGVYVDGELSGPAEEYDSTGNLTFKGSYENNVRVGICHFWDEYGGHLYGEVDEYGSLSGENITYVYPDEDTALNGTFKDSEMVEAKLMEKGFKTITFTRDVSTRCLLSKNPLLADPFETKRSYAAKSTITDAGEGLFAKTDMPADEIMSFYNGIRLTHKEVDARDWILNSNTISLDDEIVIDVPEEMSDTKVYCASLGHKANHSFTPNAKYDRFDHPRFGKIKCIRTIKPVEAGDELTVEYGYDHHGLGQNNADAPEWYRTILADFQKMQTG
eukprot:gene7172-7978_t